MPDHLAPPGTPTTQCIFCQIAAGKANSQKVYEDSELLVVLDINPANPGHCLVMTKAHYQVMPQIPDDVTGRMMEVVRKVSHAGLAALKAQGTSIFVANGAIAGQRAPHFMLHVIPRVHGDGIPLEIPKKDYSLVEFNDTKKKLQQRIAEALGMAPVKELPTTIPEHKVTMVAEAKPIPYRPAPVAAPPHEVQFIWQKPSGAHFDIKGLPVYDVEHVTRFLARHKELLDILQALGEIGPQHAIELERVADFRMNHLLALEYLGYLRLLPEGDPLLRNINRERTKNHPGRQFYAITSIGRAFIESPEHPTVLSNAVKEKILLEEMSAPAALEPLQAAPRPVPPTPPSPRREPVKPAPPKPATKPASPPKPAAKRAPAKPAQKTGHFDLDKLTDLMSK